MTSEETNISTDTTPQTFQAVLLQEINQRETNFREIEIDTDTLSEDREELLRQVFTKEFVDRYTLYNSIIALINDSTINPDDLGGIQNTQFDQFVSKTTVFDSWDHMKKKAIDEWFASECRL